MIRDEIKGFRTTGATPFSKPNLTILHLTSSLTLLNPLLPQKYPKFVIQRFFSIQGHKSSDCTLVVCFQHYIVIYKVKYLVLTIGVVIFLRDILTMILLLPLLLRQPPKVHRSTKPLYGYILF